MQFEGSKTFNKEGIPSVGMTPKNAGDVDLWERKWAVGIKQCLIYQPIWVDVPRLKGRALFPEDTVVFRNVTS